MLPRARFLSPAPPELLRALLDRGQITEEEARLAATVPLADYLTVEADSGGHTDNRPLTVVLPAMLVLREELSRLFGYRRRIRVGAGGGLGDPAGPSRPSWVIRGTPGGRCGTGSTPTTAVSTRLTIRSATPRRIDRSTSANELGLPRVDWSARQVAAHMVSLPGRYRSMIAEPRTVPTSLALDNQRELQAVPERDLVRLADLLTAEVNSLINALGDDGDRAVWYFTAPNTAAGLGGIMLTELLIHGGDVAGAVKRPWTITRRQAVACLRGVVPAIVIAADPAVAAHAAGTYHLHVRGGDHWTFRVRDGAVTVRRGRPDHADLHLSVDPVVFLRSGYGLVGPVRAALTGGVVAWGRKPWLAARFGRMFRET